MSLIELDRLVRDFAAGMERADARRPEWKNARSGAAFRPGIGPHSETATVSLVLDELVELDPLYNHHTVGVRYPGMSRQVCDWCLGDAPDWAWAIEVKLLRFFGDNGLEDENVMKRILSPYPGHNSALTDCEKLASSAFAGRKAVLIVGYDYPDRDRPVAPAIDAFEVLATRRVDLGERFSAPFRDLVHDVHKGGVVFAWEVGRRADR